MSTEPSGFCARPDRSPMLYRSMGFATKCSFASAIVSDQNASLGGRPPGGKCRMKSRSPESVCPAPSTPVFQYIASCGTFTGPGKIRAHAARVKMPLPGRPHPKRVIQPLNLPAASLARISTATTPSPAPTKKPCTRSVRTVSESAKRNERMMTKPHTTPMSAVRNVYVLLVIQRVHLRALARLAVARSGFEPLISALRGLHPRPLDERAEVEMTILPRSRQKTDPPSATPEGRSCDTCLVRSAHMHLTSLDLCEQKSTESHGRVARRLVVPRSNKVLGVERSRRARRPAH